MNKRLWIFVVLVIAICSIPEIKASTKPRVVVLTDAEIDDECSIIRFLLYSNDFNVEGIVTTSSQYHAVNHNWSGNNWIDPYLNGYESVYPNLIKNDSTYPTPVYLRAHSFLGNIDSEGEMTKVTAGSQFIVNLLLDSTNNNPIWFASWGGENTLARALKTIQDDYPSKMDYVASKLKFYFTWEQDNTYQTYIRPNWGQYNILTIICDQFWSFAYDWSKIMPADKQAYLRSSWMTPNILDGHGQLCSLYQAYKAGEKSGFNQGDFRSEGDSPSFIYLIPTGLHNPNNPNQGSWGGRFINVRANTWLDPVPVANYTYPSGRWYTSTGWGRQYMKNTYPSEQNLMNIYFNPIARWIDVLQNDFAARADWCVKPYSECNHPPFVKLKNDLNIKAKPGSKIQLSANGTYDPDGNSLAYNWWQYKEAGTYNGNIVIEDSLKQDASFTVPLNAVIGDTIHIICEVKDNGSPELTRYGRVIVTVDSVNITGIVGPKGENKFPKVFELNQNYPNPFNPTTTIKYELPESGFVTIKVFNILGKEIYTLVNAYKQAGIYNVKFNGSDLASGIYLVQMKAKSFYKSIKIVLMK